MSKQQTMSAGEYRKFMGLDKKPEKRSMNAEEWQHHMKNKKSKPDEKNKRQIRIMLQLGKIQFEEEYRFHVERKWRFDFAIIDQKIAIEYEGIFVKKSGKSRHTTVTGFEKDTEKYNAAAADGWRVLRYTANTYHNVIEDIGKIWNQPL